MQSQFDPQRHIQNLSTGQSLKLLHSDGSVLDGISGVPGAAELIESGAEVGVDRIIMDPGAEFELHTHPGAHILYVLKARGFIHVDGVDYDMVEGDSVYVPANFAHGVKTNKKVDEPFEILAFGVPHMPIDSRDRMTVVRR
ncbi:cupin domain-containing protein [Micromonospora sp. CPCC 205546]|uniref:cupin domain-containing protein n=1 Tax=Micromonospora sp. CPCC 205546 TaxID=3122397 RepID=UPI002FEEE551